MTQQAEAAPSLQTLAESSKSANEAALSRPDGEIVTPPVPDVEKVETLGDEAVPLAVPVEDPARVRFTEVAERARKDRIRRQREAKEVQDTRLERDRAARAAETNAQRVAELEAEREEARRNPEGFLRAQGITPDQIAQRAVEEGTPEGQMKTMRAELERVRAAQVERDRRDAEAQATRDARAAQDDFVRESAEDVECPTIARLAKRNPEMLTREAEVVARRVHAKTGRYPSFPQIRAYLEHEFSKALSDGATRVETREPARAATPGKSQTLTSRTAEKAQQPVPFEQMSREEQRAHLLSKLG